MKVEHQYRTAAECACGQPGCWVCDGGLSICKVCGLYEGGLTTECPGAKSHARADDVYRGLKDFRDGRWVRAVSCHCPEHYRQLAAARGKTG